MCFGNSLKGDNPEEHLNARPVTSKIPNSSKVSSMPQSSDYTPPAGPPPNYQGSFAPPVGPPPGHGEAYTAPPGPPPSRGEEYSAPPGPPPSHREEYNAPPGPPPSQHNWQQAVPDTSLLPPPPSLGDDRSPTNNATEDEAVRGENWCKKRPLQAPMNIHYEALQAVESGDVTMVKPSMMSGEIRALKQGTWHSITKRNSPDSCILSALPLYSVIAHSPLQTRNSKTIYFEVKILPKSRANEVSVGLGFVAAPYPPFRLPGWERASLGVHGDDGHRYVNDRWGGRSFTAPFKPGETLGIGMIFSKRIIDLPPAYDSVPVQTTAQTPINVEVFFTRNGRKDGGWNLHEELDADQDLPVTGLEGMHDLYAAVGTFDAAEFEMHFDPLSWLYKP